MEQFEKYHPLLTDHYTLDWLTVTPLKTVNQTLPQLSENYHWTSFSQSAHYLNQTMLAVMRNQKLVWGITRRTNQALVGVASLTEFHQQQVHLRIALLSTDEAVDEIAYETLTYLTAFVFAELNLNQITLQTPFPKSHLLQELGYSYQHKSGRWQIQRAVSINR